jgi:hypothetical protein
MRDRIELVITELADQLVWPVDSARVDRSVIDHLGDRSHRRSPTRRRKLAYTLAAVSIFSIVVYLVPPARQAIANLFGAAGIQITFGDPAFERAIGDLELGREVEIGAIDDAAGFDVVAPAGSDPGPAGGVFVGENGEVNMAWEGTLELPAAGDTGIGLILTQREERSDAYQGVKTVSPETEVEAVLVDGAQGFWIEGTPHTLVLVDETGVEREETRRLAANVLLWAKDGISYRLETTGDLASALAIAESLSPIADGFLG